MSYAFRQKRKARRREIREHREEGERLGTVANQIRRGTAPRFTWWRGSAIVEGLWQIVNRPSGAKWRFKQRRAGWRRRGHTRIPPIIKRTTGVLFPNLK